MSKKELLTEEEKTLFREAMKAISPLKQDKLAKLEKPRKTANKRLNTRPEETSDHQAIAASQTTLDNIHKEDWLSGEDCIHFARGGIQHRVIQKLKRGKLNIEARLDLHQLTADEALSTIERFMAHCGTKDIRWVCIVHGKGYRSAGGKPILKNLLNQWLRQCRQVLAFHSAQPKDGGTGALYVLLKSKERTDRK